MRVTIFGTKGYDRRFLSEANAAHGHELVFLEPRLDLTTAPLAKGQALCAYSSTTASMPKFWRRWPRWEWGWWRCAVPGSTM